MISIEDFIQLSLSYKAQYTWSFGSFLTSLQIEGLKVNLYSVNNFYVEIWYNPVKNKIEKIYPLKTAQELHKYASLINIDSLLE